MPGSVSGGSVSPFSRRPGSGAGARCPFQQQEPVGQHHHGRVVVEPAPAPALEVVQAQLLLHLLVPLLHRPPLFHSRTAFRRDVLGGRFEGVLALARRPAPRSAARAARRGHTPRASTRDPARPAARRTAPTAAPWFPPATSPAATSSPFATASSDTGGGDFGASTRGPAPGRVRRCAAGEPNCGCFGKTTISSVTPTM